MEDTTTPATQGNKNNIQEKLKNTIGSWFSGLAQKAGNKQQQQAPAVATDGTITTSTAMAKESDPDPA